MQIVRNGSIAAVEGWLLRSDGKKLIYGDNEKELIKSFKSYLNTLNALTVEPPMFVFLTLLGVKGYSMVVRESYGRTESYTIDRDVLQLPEAVIENYDGSADKILRPCFDAIWNACGYPRDLYYNDADEWAPKG